MSDQAKALRETFATTRSGLFENQISLDQKPAPVFALGKTFAKTIAITSGKGGVGKSTIGLSLALSLAALGKKVCIIDADLGLANIHLLLGIVPKRNLSNYVNEECSLSDIIIQGPRGVDIIPGASGMEQLANLEPLRLALLQKNLAQVERAYDYLIIDTGAGIGTITVEFASKADLALVVLTSEPTSFADAYAMVKILYERKVNRVGIVLNMISSENEGKETFDKLNALVVKFLKRPLYLVGCLPVDKQVSYFAKHQKMLVLENPRSVFATKMTCVARTVSGVQGLGKQGFFARLFKS